ncbi:uncharacterized protein LOC116261146 [Nymphaea colorata]|nr:uncharacterized protein LOC116261146 [Nymphaea colorata]
MAGSRKACDRGDPKAVGCLSAIFRLLHGRIHGRRKRLTQAGKTEQSCTHREEFEEVATNAHSTRNADQNQKKTVPRQSEPKLMLASSDDSCKSINFDGSQSTMLTAEHINQQALEAAGVPSEEQSRRPSVVARLMGLEDFPVKQLAGRTENASEMRDLILGALQKCDEEVRALRRIIEVLQSVERHDYRLVAPSRVVAAHTDSGRFVGRRRGQREKYVPMDLKVKPEIQSPMKCTQFNCEQPSPVSVLDDRSSFHCQGRMPTKGYWRKYDKEQRPDVNNVISRSNSMNGKGSYQCHNLIRDAYAKPFGGATISGASIKLTSTHDVGADLEGVEGSAGKESFILELERIALALETEIFGSLLEESISELGFACRRPSLRFFRCRRRLFR